MLMLTLMLWLTSSLRRSSQWRELDRTKTSSCSRDTTAVLMDTESEAWLGRTVWVFSLMEIILFLKTLMKTSQFRVWLKNTWSSFIICHFWPFMPNFRARLFTDVKKQLCHKCQTFPPSHWVQSLFVCEMSALSQNEAFSLHTWHAMKKIRRSFFCILLFNK